MDQEEIDFLIKFGAIFLTIIAFSFAVWINIFHALDYFKIEYTQKTKKMALTWIFTAIGIVASFTYFLSVLFSL